jgi:hypothetical protein
VYPFERFTEDARKTLALAQQEAERSRHSHIGTEHLATGREQLGGRKRVASRPTPVVFGQRAYS